MDEGSSFVSDPDPTTGEAGLDAGSTADGATREDVVVIGPHDASTDAGAAPDACHANLERCNSADDDCDNQIDEDFLGDDGRLGEPCVRGAGACLRRGSYVCTAGGHSTHCSAPEVTTDAGEECNQIDDNCDGLIDYWVSEAGSLESACKCKRLPIPTPEAGEECGQGEPCRRPTCALSQEYHLTMSVCLAPPLDGGVGVGARLGDGGTPCGLWNQCKLSTAKLEDFDANEGGRGLLQVSFQWQSISGQGTPIVSLYYGSYPGRKRVVVSAGRPSTGGMVTRYYKPEDFGCDFEVGVGEACESACPLGRRPPSCPLRYRDVPLWLAVVSQDPKMHVEATIADVHIERLTGEVCTCIANSDCLDVARAICDLTPQWQSPRCSAVGVSNCLGVCVP